MVRWAIVAGSVHDLACDRWLLWWFELTCFPLHLPCVTYCGSSVSPVRSLMPHVFCFMWPVSNCTPLLWARFFWFFYSHLSVMTKVGALDEVPCNQWNQFLWFCSGSLNILELGSCCSGKTLVWDKERCNVELQGLPEWLPVLSSTWHWNRGCPADFWDTGC